VPVARPSPRPPAAASLALPGGEVDLRTRVLVVGVVPAPRFGRENEVVATAAAVAARGADLVDVSHGPRLIGPAARAGGAPVAVRAVTLDDAAAAARAGAAVVLVPVEVAAAVDPSAVGADPGLAGAPTPPLAGTAVAVVVATLDDLPAGLAAAERLGMPLAFDSTALAPDAALAAESVAVVDGCRLLRTADVRRSRRVATVLGAMWEARRG
jgi:hypothetical protein